MSKTVLLHHDSARPHVAAATIETICHLKFKVLPHPPYSPNLTLCDFHATDPLKGALRGHRFGSDEEAKEVVHMRLREQPETFFCDGIKKLVDRYKKCVILQVDSVER
jgi:histone-lysine N-methyltransferase SETMAR